MGYHYGVRYRPMRQFLRMTTSCCIASVLKLGSIVFEPDLMCAAQRRQPRMVREMHILGRKSFHLLRGVRVSVKFEEKSWVHFN